MGTATLDDRAQTIGPRETADRLGIKASTLRNWRSESRGPRYVKFGKLVRYRLADIAEFLDQKTRSTEAPERSV